MADERTGGPLAASDDAARALAEIFLHEAARFDGAGKALAKANCSVDIPVTGRSMGATLPDGSVIRVSLGDGASCRVGDVVVFRQREQIVAHRVIYRAASHLISRGDARIAPDPPVPFDRVLGRVTGIIASGEVLQPPAMPERHWLVRFANSSAMRMTVLALHISPALAGRSSRVLTWMERRSPTLSRVAGRRVAAARDNPGAAAV